MKKCRPCSARILALLALASLPASAAMDVIYQDGFDPHFGFQIQTPLIAVQPGQATSFCYYSHTPNSGALGIRRWLSTMAPGIDRMIVYTTSIDRQPVGTLTQDPCGFNTGGGIPAFVYIAHDASQDLVFPGNDGNDLPLAMQIAPGQPIVIEMFTSNYTGTPVTASVLLKAEAIDPFRAYTRSATYLTEASDFEIPAQTNGFSVQKTCSVPTGAKFWRLSTRTHKFATESAIRDGSSEMALTTNWEHPEAAEFRSLPFYAFTSGGLTYRCVYSNTTNSRITAGDDESTDESCMGIGYFFPAPTGSKLCINNTGPL